MLFRSYRPQSLQSWALTEVYIDGHGDVHARGIGFAEFWRWVAIRYAQKVVGLGGLLVVASQAPFASLHGTLCDEIHLAV